MFISNEKKKKKTSIISTKPGFYLKNWKFGKLQLP